MEVHQAEAFAWRFVRIRWWEGGRAEDTDLTTALNLRKNEDHVWRSRRAFFVGRQTHICTAKERENTHECESEDLHARGFDCSTEGRGGYL